MRLLKSNSLFKLANMYLIDASQPSNISYAWNFGVRRARALFSWGCLASIIYSVVSTSTLYKLRVSPLNGAKNDVSWIAGNKCLVRPGLPPVTDSVSRCKYVKDNEPDTQRRDLFSKCILSRISRYIVSIADHNNQSMISSREAHRHPHIGSRNEVEQVTKFTEAINRNSRRPRDLTAYVRGTSGDGVTHTSLIVGAKGYSTNALASNKTSGSKKSKGRKTKDKAKARPVRPTLASVVFPKLDKSRTYDGKYNNLIHMISDTNFMIACYNEIKGNPGNMTPGSTQETLDGLNLKWFQNVGRDIGEGKFNFSPARRKDISKRNSTKKRTLTIASPREKIVQKALQVVMEAIWEPEFTESSHGFRPGRGVHSALSQLYYGGQTFIWVIQGDISGCFDNIPHELIIKQIKNKIVDHRTIQLITKYLKTGSWDQEKNRIQERTIGIPQGGILSPILCNIVMDRFDKYMEKTTGKFHKGSRRAHNREYQRLEYKRRKTKNREERTRILIQMRKVGNVDRFDKNFKRMKYIRYADDFVILIIGNIHEAHMMKKNSKEFLKNNCGVELNTEKTKITKMTKGFEFLGAQITKPRRRHTFLCSRKEHRKNVATPRLLIRAPIAEILKDLKKAGYIKQNNLKVYIPTYKGALINLSHHDIITYFNSKIYGLLNFYSFASNLNKLSRVIWYIHASCALTLARKLKIKTMRGVFQKFGKTLRCPETGREIYKPKTMKVKHQYQVRKSVTHPKDILEQSWVAKITNNVFNRACILCGSPNQVEMHHYRTVKDVRAKLRTGDLTFAQWEGAVKRKQIPLCKYHHDLYHKGQLNYGDIKEIAEYSG